MTLNEKVEELRAITPALSTDDIKSRLDAWKASQPIQGPEPESILPTEESMSFQTAAAPQDASVVAPEQTATEKVENTELQSIDFLSELAIPEEELLKINEKVKSLDLKTSIQQKRLGGKFSQDFSVDVIPYEEQRVEAEKMLKAEGVEINEQAIQDQMRVLIRSKEEDNYRAREHDKNAPGFFSFDTVKRIGSTVGTIFSGTVRGESFVFRRTK